ncbi:6834_t:CDS:2 [Paraglomus occultum]|uniref:6834_t:CDS:1 n=1 Tax=Paraglomus occultum TaxID=144539 RepID=A0A9N8ZB21_9GLOM|nr:6834_t:CDS:2 [Paraglomus occultum]
MSTDPTHKSSTVATKLKQPTLQEILAQSTRIGSKFTTPPRVSPVFKKTSVLPSRVSTSPFTPHCKGISLTTGQPCRRPVVVDHYCFHHRAQTSGSVFGLPTNPTTEEQPNDARQDGETEVLNENSDTGLDSLSTTSSFVDQKDDEQLVGTIRRLSINNQNRNATTLRKRSEVGNQSTQTKLNFGQDEKVEVIDLASDASENKSGTVDKSAGIARGLSNQNAWRRSGAGKQTSQTKLNFDQDCENLDSSARATVISIQLDNNVEVKITQLQQASGSTSKTDISTAPSCGPSESQSERNTSDIHDSDPNPKDGPNVAEHEDKQVQTDTSDNTRDQSKGPPEHPIPLESPAVPDDSFIETTHKDLFRTPTTVTPDTQILTAPWLSSSPTQAIYATRPIELGSSPFRSLVDGPSILWSNQEFDDGEQSSEKQGEFVTPSSSTQQSPAHTPKACGSPIPIKRGDHDLSPAALRRSLLPLVGSPTPRRNVVTLEKDSYKESLTTDVDTSTPSEKYPPIPSFSLLSSPVISPPLRRTSTHVHVDLTGDTPSVFSSPLNSSNFVQCCGINKTGKRCIRRVKCSEHDRGEVQYCHQHRVEYAQTQNTDVESVLFVPGRSRMVWLKFEEWINPDLPEEIRRLLRSEMEKPISESDEPGFIYAYHIVSGSDTHRDPYSTLYKVGRTTNLHRRIYQWSQHCGYTPEVIEYFPNVSLPPSLSRRESLISNSSLSTIDDYEDIFADVHEDESNNPFWSLKRCKYSHRAERLIHIELGERFRADIEKCSGCGIVHREWFKVTASAESEESKGGLIGWEEVKKIIVHWVTYIEKVYGVG